MTPTETKAKHTPGPWTAEDTTEGNTREIQRFHDCELGFQIWAKQRIAFTERQNVGADVEAANARLIAAAPELLAACKRAEASAWLVATSGNADAVAIHEELRTAIAKAEGAA